MKTVMTFRYKQHSILVRRCTEEAKPFTKMLESIRMNKTIINLCIMQHPYQLHHINSACVQDVL